MAQRPAGLVWKLIAAAATVAAVLGLVMRLVPGPIVPEIVSTLPPAVIIAKVIAASDAVREENLQGVVGDAVPRGPIRLASGQAQIAFASGAIVTLHAPVALEVLSAERVFLRHGRITPYVPPPAHGFTVVSPSGEIVELGTEFTVGVDAAGRTDVFVIDGEVDVASGHTRVHHDAPLRMTQGFGSRMVATDSRPVSSLEPIIVDHFIEGHSGPLRWIDHDEGYVSVVREGAFWIPIAAPSGRKEPFVRSVLDHDWSVLVGRRSTISFKVTLPEEGTTDKECWLALAVDDGTGEPPRAFDLSASCAVLLSPHWQVGVRVDGEPVAQGCGGLTSPGGRGCSCRPSRRPIRAHAALPSSTTSA